jgi:hypothetical protein
VLRDDSGGATLTAAWVAGGIEIKCAAGASGTNLLRVDLEIELGLNLHQVLTATGKITSVSPSDNAWIGAGFHWDDAGSDSAAISILRYSSGLAKWTETVAWNNPEATMSTRTGAPYIISPDGTPRAWYTNVTVKRVKGTLVRMHMQIDSNYLQDTSTSISSGLTQNTLVSNQTGCKPMILIDVTNSVAGTQLTYLLETITMIGA